MGKHEPKIGEVIIFSHDDGKDYEGTVDFISSNKKFAGCYPNSFNTTDILVDISSIKGLKHE